MNEQHPVGGVDAGLTFEEVFCGQYATTVRLAHLLTGSSSSAEHITQEAFARLHRHFASVENLGGYLRTVTVNLCRNWHRSGIREAKYLARHGAEASSGLLGADEMLDAVNSLPFRQRAVVILRYWLDLTEADIAAIIGSRPGTVKSLHARAMEHLRKVVPE